MPDSHELDNVIEQLQNLIEMQRENREEIRQLMIQLRRLITNALHSIKNGDTIFARQELKTALNLLGEE